MNADIDDIGSTSQLIHYLDNTNIRILILVIGPSTTQLFSNLGQALEFPPDAEIVISSIDHETNISPWLRAAKAHKLTVKWWTPSKGLTLTAENLRPLLSERTRLVTCTHTSNVLGTIHDIKAIADEVHKVHGAMLCVDGVAYAPHREVDVKALDVDFYSFSWYKVAAIRRLRPRRSYTDDHRYTVPTSPFFTPRHLLENRSSHWATTSTRQQSLLGLNSALQLLATSLSLLSPLYSPTLVRIASRHGKPFRRMSKRYSLFYWSSSIIERTLQYTEKCPIARH